MKDENWKNESTNPDNPTKAGTVEEYRDFEDRVVLKRVWESESKKLDTYYVYDDFGDLRFVIPPGVSPSTNSFTVSTANATTHVYAYKYDGRRRLVEKWLPGKGVEYIVYNKNDMPILTQDAVQRIAKQWSYTKYDAFGRVVNTGLYTNSVQTTREQVQQLVDAHKVNNVAYYWEERNNTLNYTNRSFPTSGRVMQVWHHYDDYDFKETTFLPPSVDTSSLVKTLLTGTRVYLEDGTQGKLTVYYYDKHARMVQSPSQNHLGGTDYVTNTYSFVGELLTSKQEHKPSSGSTTTILTSNTYDHVGRLLDTKKKVNSQAEVVQSRLTYNEIGQLRRKLLHGENGGSKFIDTVDYAYNERGWVKDLKSPYFTQQLRYIDPVSGDDAEPQYNGNIAQSRWGYGKSFTDRFHYHYDKLNRLKDGHKLAGALMREQLVYDDMGNITNLKRDNHSAGISYSYSGNKLTSLSGQLQGTYTYDGNGNATKDRTGMSFTYNHLNLPKTATKSGTSVSYLYNAMGEKLRKTATVGSTTTVRDYIGGIEYHKTGSAASVIELIHTEEGYLQRDNNNVYTYHYHLKDHLGNVRAVLQRTSATSGTVIQKQDYYPFGKTKGILTGGKNQYLYNGKEVQPELGGQLDYGARFYDAEIGRWNVLDPLAEKYAPTSPYTYAINSPIIFVDPDGMDIRIFYKVTENGVEKSKSFVFNGSNYHNAPDNYFVKSFIQAYKYNIENGGGDNLLAAATSKEYTINLQQGKRNSSTSRTVFWNPFEAGEYLSNTGERIVLSPATILEHEFDHAVVKKIDYEEYKIRKSTVDQNFDNKEEARVIKGSEAKTGQRNGEIQEGQYRRDHKARLRTVKVGDPTSTKEFSWEKWLISFGNDVK